MTLKHITREFLRGEMLTLTRFEKKKNMYNHIIKYQQQYNKPFPIGQCAIFNEDTEDFECCGWDKNCSRAKVVKDEE